MHTASIRRIGLGHGPIKPCCFAGGNVQLNVARGRTKGQLVLANRIRPGKIPHNAIGSGNAHVANEGEEPGQDRQGRPDEAVWKEVTGMVNRWGGRRGCAKVVVQGRCMHFGTELWSERERGEVGEGSFETRLMRGAGAAAAGCCLVNAVIW
jgi:hypothetical protein